MIGLYLNIFMAFFMLKKAISAGLPAIVAGMLGLCCSSVPHSPTSPIHSFFLPQCSTRDCCCCA